MIQIKKLKRASKRSGQLLKQGETAELKKFGVRIVNVSAGNVYVDSVTPKKKKK